MTPTITAFANSPDRGRGLARDMRVRWALEEVGQAYDVRLVTLPEMKQPAHLALSPFGQIPTWEEGDLVLFETGAIVLRIAETHAGLLPLDANGRARAIAWIFAAVNTIEPPILEMTASWLFEQDKSWYAERRVAQAAAIDLRLKSLSARLGEADWVDGEFSVGDLMTIHAIARLETSGLLQPYANLLAYVERGRARPAYQRAFAAQKAVFEAAQ